MTVTASEQLVEQPATQIGGAAAAPAKRVSKAPRRKASTAGAAEPVVAAAVAPAEVAVPEPAPEPAASTGSTPTPAKVKLVRDSFTMPQAEYEQLAALKRRALGLAYQVKKSELLRAGVAALVALDDAALLQALQAVPSIKTGRPKGDKVAQVAEVPAPAADAPAAKSKNKAKGSTQKR